MLSSRKHYRLFLTNTKSASGGPYSLEFPENPTFTGTLNQIRAEIVEFRRISGGCDIGWRVEDADGKKINRHEIEDFWRAKRNMI